MTERDIFLAVLDLPDPAARANYLDSACAGDVARRARVEELLQAHENAGSFLAEPVVAAKEPGRGTEAFSSTADGAIADDEDLSYLSSPRRPDSIGRIGHYEVLEVLGRGGFGIVFRAHDEVLQRVVAVKVLAPSMAATSPARKRFLREARSSAQVRHENVVQVYAVEEQPLPYLVMEFIPGETLQQRLDRNGPLDVPEVLRIGRQVAEGLAAAHAQGLIHRDIKPANVMIEGGAGRRVKLTDFGLARAADDASISQSGVVAGTPMYMAPEQAKGETLDHRADLFSLGSVMYAMLTGHPPFRASATLAVLKRVTEDTPRPIREVIPEVPVWLCRIVEKLHAKDPAERFQSAREVADLLADCETQLQAHGAVRDFSRIPGGRTVGKQNVLRGRRLINALAVAVVLAAGAYVVLVNVIKHRDLRELLASQATIPLDVGESPTSRPGWFELFNGKNLDGWHEVGSKGTWIADNGVLRAIGRAGYLVSDRSFDSFHLKAEVRISPGTDFGVLFHADRVAAKATQPTTNGHGVEFAYTGPVNDVTGQVSMAMQFTGEIPGARAGHYLKPHEWLPFDLIVRPDGVSVNIAGGMIGADYPRSRKAGPIVLRLAKDDSVVELRNIRIQDLQSTVTGEPNIPVDAARADQQAIQGTWKAVAGDFQGQRVPDIVIDAVRPTVTFVDDKLTWKANPSPEAKDVFGGFLANFRPEGVFHVDPTKNPKSIDMTVLGQNVKSPIGSPVPRVLLGIYNLDGDTFEMCIAIDPDHAEERPTKFESVPGKAIGHFRLKRQPTATERPAVIEAERELVSAKERALKTVEAQVAAGFAAVGERVSAQIDLINARVRLAEAENDRKTVVSLLQELVANREEQRRVIALLVEAGRAAPAELDRADVQIADAKARRARASSDVGVAPLAPAVVEPGVIKTFGPADRPLTQNGVGASEGGWFIHADTGRSVYLYDVPNPGLLRGAVAARAQVKVQRLDGMAYLELAVRYPGMPRGAERPTSKKLISAMAGKSEWQAIEVVFPQHLLRDGNPEGFEINLQLDGKADLWIKDVELRAVGAP
jgi:uncharacterized protein (TIGR03067 family)